MSEESINQKLGKLDPNTVNTYAFVKGHLKPTHLKSSPLFTFTTELLGQIHHQFTSFLKKLGQDSPPRK